MRAQPNRCYRVSGGRESHSGVPPVLEASTLTHAQRRGLFARRSPLLRFQDDENLVALTRKGHQHAFDALVERYQARLLGFCRQMLGSTEDAEDVLQEVFVAAYNAMVADERPIAVRPWLYRIARNRCLNHLRKPTADGQDTMDTHPHMNGVTTLERVQNREEFRNLLTDVGKLPETQRSALLLREIDAMSYDEIAQAMDTTVPGVKSLLVRARIALAESSQARQLTCDEVRLELAEAAEGLTKASGPVRRHIKTCDPCREFRSQLRSDTKALAAIFPAAPLIILKGALLAKLSGIFGGGGGGAAAGARRWRRSRCRRGCRSRRRTLGRSCRCRRRGRSCRSWSCRRWCCRSGRGRSRAGAGAAGAGAAAAGGTAAIGGAAAAGGAAAGGGAAAAAGGAAAAIGTKAAAGIATAAIIAGGAAEIQHVSNHPAAKPTPKTRTAEQQGPDDRRQATADRRSRAADRRSPRCGYGGGHHSTPRHGHRSAPAGRSNRDDGYRYRRNHSRHHDQAQAPPQERDRQQRLPAQDAGADGSGHDRRRAVHLRRGRRRRPRRERAQRLRHHRRLGQHRGRAGRGRARALLGAQEAQGQGRA